MAVLTRQGFPEPAALSDHVAVASSGVWVIDAKRHKGLIELRDVGGWFRLDRQLFVVGRRRTKLVEDRARQMEAVPNARGISKSQSVRGVVFSTASGGCSSSPSSERGIVVSWPKSLDRRSPRTIRTSAETFWWWRPDYPSRCLPKSIPRRTHPEENQNRFQFRVATLWARNWRKKTDSSLS